MRAFLGGALANRAIERGVAGLGSAIDQRAKRRSIAPDGLRHRRGHGRRTAQRALNQVVYRPLESRHKRGRQEECGNDQGAETRTLRRFHCQPRLLVAHW